MTGWEEYREAVRRLGEMAEGLHREAEYRRGAQYVSVMNALVGYDITATGRTPEAVAARNIVAYCLTAEGYTETAVGEILRRNHSTVNHGKGKVPDYINYPRQFPAEYQLYNDFKQLTEKI